MHLLAAQRGSIAEGTEAIDLGQSPGEILFLSAADTELASLAFAARRMGFGPAELRLANLMRLSHPMSVDTYVERMAGGARLVVVRLLGGERYWPHGCEALLAASQRFGFRLAILPGDDKPDAGLERFSTLEADARDRLWRCLAEGGAANATSFLGNCRSILSGESPEHEPKPLLKAGIWERAGSGGGEERPTVPVVFYRALVQSGQTEAVDALCEALDAEGLSPLPLFVTSLKDPVSVETLRAVFARRPPAAVVNLTSFAVSAPGLPHKPTVLDESGAVVLQAVLAGSSRETWEASTAGLSGRDLAMSVALPEVDGRVLTRAIAFKAASEWDALTECDLVRPRAEPGRCRFTAELAARWARLRALAPPERHVAIVLANYPNRDGRIGNGVGLDTPAGTVRVMEALREAGYDLPEVPANGNALVEHLLQGPTNSGERRDRLVRETLPLRNYLAFFDALPEAVRSQVIERWGAPEADPFFDSTHGFCLPLARFGKVAVGVQPARGYNIDPKSTYHAPDLVPPHGYLAFYAWLRESFRTDAVVHMGKHGNLEWLPGKALALSEACFPEAVFGPLPHLYPFIVNDPGEGSQAKRRTSAVIVDHLTPPLTRATSHGPARDLERLVDEYYEASAGDPRRVTLLRREIMSLLETSGLGLDAGLGRGDIGEEGLEKLDAWLCDLKEMQIRDGLHVFGLAPEGRLLTDLTVALARLPRGLGPGDASLHRALAADLGLGFDPLDCEFSTPWTGPRPLVLHTLSTDNWRTVGDTVERLELLCIKLVGGETQADPAWERTSVVLQEVESRLKPAVTQCGAAEIAGLLRGLDGCFVAPGPSGAPTRGRPDTLPTGRNFFSVDTRAVPTEAAWTLGRRSAELVVQRHFQDHGEWLRAVGLTCWGTANMRTGGDDIAQGMALMGVKPTWDRASGRVTGFEIVPLAKLGRPRVDVTLRVSGFFRDAFPDQIALFDRAARAVGALDEDESENPVAARMRREAADLTRDGVDDAEAKQRAGFRVFGSKPGAYGAGLQALMDEGGWERRADLAESFLVWGSYAYGAGADGVAERAALERRLGQVEAVIQNQDNREHDLLDSDDYYQFEGGMSAAVEHLAGRAPAAYHNDHSRPERPLVRTLDEEIARVLRARVVNPKWIAGVMRHGYKGAFEVTATVDYLFAFAATTNAVRDHHFDLVHAAFVEDETVAGFMRENNPNAFREMCAKLREAIRRGLWHPRSNAGMLTPSDEEALT